MIGASAPKSSIVNSIVLEGSASLKYSVLVALRFTPGLVTVPLLSVFLFTPNSSQETATALDLP